MKGSECSDRIQKQEITIDQLFDAIFRLEIINITLENDDNPQLIFESLNSTGSVTFVRSEYFKFDGSN